MKSEDIKWAIIILGLFSWFCFSEYNEAKIEHEKTIQKAIECGYEPIVIGGDYWNKGD